MNTAPRKNDDIAARLVVIDDEKKCLEFTNKQTFYKAVELLEKQERAFFMVER